MKKTLLSLAVAGALALGLSAPALAAGPPGPNPAFEDSGCGSLGNVHNEALRFGFGGRIAIPGVVGVPADNENAAVETYNACGTEGSIVAPGQWEPQP